MRTLIVAAALVLIGVPAVISAAPPTRGTMSWAVVNMDGSLRRGFNAVSSRQLGADGTFEVIFNHDVSTCAYVATGGESFQQAGPDDSLVMTAALRQGNNNGVALIMYDSILMRDSYSSGFHLLVVC